MNPFKTLKALRPLPPVLVGIVREIHDDDTSTVEIPGNVPLTGYGDGTTATGSLIRPRGSHVPVGGRAFIRAGVIETRAPDVETLDVGVGSVVIIAPPPPPPPTYLLLETFTGSGSMNGLAPDEGPTGVVWTQAGYAAASKNGAGYFATTGVGAQELIYYMGNPLPTAIAPFYDPGVIEIKFRRSPSSTSPYPLSVSLRDSGFDSSIEDGISQTNFAITGYTYTHIDFWMYSDESSVDESDIYISATNVLSTTVDDVVRVEIEPTQQRLYLNGVLKATLNGNIASNPFRVDEIFIEFEGRIDYFFVGSDSSVTYP